MKATLIRSAIILAAAMVLTACASAPAKTTGEESLVVIPTAMVNDTGKMFARNFYLQFSDNQKEQLIPQYKTATILVVVKGPGVKVTGIRSVVDRSKGFTGPDGFQSTNFELPYVPGRLVVAAQGYTLSVKEVAARTYVADANLNQVDNATVDALYQSYKGKKDFAPWFED